MDYHPTTGCSRQKEVTSAFEVARLKGKEKRCVPVRITAHMDFDPVDIRSGIGKDVVVNISNSHRGSVPSSRAHGRNQAVRGVSRDPTKQPVLIID
jgi:hypothetical protein